MSDQKRLLRQVLRLSPTTAQATGVAVDGGVVLLDERGQIDGWRRGCLPRIIRRRLGRFPPSAVLRERVDPGSSTFIPVIRPAAAELMLQRKFCRGREYFDGSWPLTAVGVLFAGGSCTELTSLLKTTYEEIMKKLLTFVAAAVLGISMIGCAEKKPATPPAANNPAPPGGDAAKPEGGAAPVEPAPAPTEEKK